MSGSGYRDAAEKAKTLAHPENEKRKRILVVEDNQLSLMLLKQLLEVHGYEIMGTPEGLEAIDIARYEQPDLILMDIRLPDICGLDVTHLLKRDNQTRTIPIIAVTALWPISTPSMMLISSTGRSILRQSRRTRNGRPGFGPRRRTPLGSFAACVARHSWRQA